MKNEKFTKDYKFVARSKGYYEVMWFLYNEVDITRETFFLDCEFTNNNDFIDIPRWNHDGETVSVRRPQ